MPRKKKNAPNAATNGVASKPTSAGRLETLKLRILDYVTGEAQSLPAVKSHCDEYADAEISEAIDLLVEADRIELDFSTLEEGLVQLVDEGHGPAVLDPSGDFDGHSPTEHDDDGPLDLDADEDSDDDLDGEGVGAPPGAAKPSYGPTRYLKHFFTEAEVLEMRMKREDLDAEIDKLQGELDTLAKRVKYLKSCIETNQIEGLELSRSIKTGSEMRDVVVEERKEIDLRAESLTKGRTMMVAYRTDTDEAIDWRELSYAERQGSLFDPAAATPAVTEQRAAN